jgi:hypothetical protein
MLCVIVWMKSSNEVTPGAEDSKTCCASVPLLENTLNIMNEVFCQFLCVFFSEYRRLVLLVRVVINSTKLQWFGRRGAGPLLSALLMMPMMFKSGLSYPTMLDKS